MNTIKKNTNFIFILVICFLIIIFIGYVALYFVGIQGNRLSDKIEDYSGFGSYLGGVSSIFSVFSILFLIWTYRKDKNESLIKEEENKLTRYFEYLISAKAHIKGSYKQKEYSKEEIGQLITRIVYASFSLSDKTIPQSVNINNEDYPFDDTQLLLISLTNAFSQTQNLFILIMKFIYLDSKYVNKKDSLILLLSFFSHDEIIVLLFILSRSWDNNHIFLKHMCSFSSLYGEMFQKCKISNNYYYHSSFSKYNFE